MTDSPANILRRAKAKIEDPAHWCRDTHALNAIGTPVIPTDVNACAWCAAGALAAVGDGEYSLLLYLDRAATELYPSLIDDDNWFHPVAQVNDSSDHPTIMKVYDRAIALAEQEGQ